jgi:hypothetical protein
MVPQGFLGIPQEGKGIPFLGVSEKREGGKGTQSLVGRSAPEAYPSHPRPPLLVPGRGASLLQK